ncbi:crotonase/enoyl-CoA hydratase family protein [Hoyosella subflava]|uniref:Enoyl-CoA hydratase n=1 Tax=Hoyosella subflava (strain DSM 45089 / JCM 17490 / NBRC 109087 / DQS3-9A1) TaxID=443218 RepID=F6ELX2_HOYSD|nr:crotonase/enoyl-CoA hydratase family protein [Hoyosella subflava]AEF42753.1 Enoyl-CoA hydratase [Hoyosella subflava DQS3-9A1]
MTFETLECEKSEGILTITLSRPKKLNAFTIRMADELVDAFDLASKDDEIAAIIVTGSGRAFCAGMDLTVAGNAFGLDTTLDPSTASVDGWLDDRGLAGIQDSGGRVALSIYGCTKPVIAAINGAAIGVGATMTLPMDIRLCTPAARIGFVFGRLGIVPEACSTWFLPRIVGLDRALELAYRADILTAEEAREFGLVRNIVPEGELLSTARAQAKKFTSNRSPVATALTRQMMYRNSAERHPVAAHKVDSLAMFYTSIGDGAEGVAAFLEKREPRFSTSVVTDMPPFYPWQPDLPPAK